MNIFEHSGEYKHFKGGEYKVVCNVLCGEESLVLYKSVKNDSYWLRETQVFFEMVERDNQVFPRFKKVGEMDDVLASLEYQEFLLRMKKGEHITFEADLSQYKLSKDSTLEMPKVQEIKQGDNMDFQTLVAMRQSCRSYDKDKKVSKEDIETILKCGMLAPSACNSQPWKFTVATDEKALEVALATQSMGMNKFTSDVPVFIVISEGAYNKTALVGSKVKDQDYRSVDIGLATSQICLCATSIGLSTCILGWFDEKKLKNLVGTKSRIRLVIALGYASEDDKQRNKVRKQFEEVVDYIK